MTPQQCDHDSAVPVRSVVTDEVIAARRRYRRPLWVIQFPYPI